MKIAFIGDVAPALKESGQVAAGQSNPGEFNLAMAAVLALLNSPAPAASPANNNSGTESTGGGLEPVSLPVIEPEATVLEKQQAINPQETGQADHEASAGSDDSIFTPAADTDISTCLLAGQVQDSSKIVTAGFSKEAELLSVPDGNSEYISAKRETGPVQSGIISTPGEAGENAPVFTGILQLEKDYELPALVSPRANDSTNPTETGAPLVRAEQNQALASGPQSGSVVEPGGGVVFTPAAALTSAKETVTSLGQDVSLLAGTVKETVTATVKDMGPLFTEASRETGVGTGQVNQAGAAAAVADGTELENTTFARLEGSVIAQQRDPVIFEKALVAGASPAFDAGSMSVAPVRSGTVAAAQEIVLKAVPPYNPSAAGQESAAAPDGETRTSGEAIKSAGKEDVILPGKAESVRATAVDADAAKSGSISAGSSVEDAPPPNLAQFETITSKENPVENLKTVKIPDLKESLVQEIERFYNNRKSEPLTQVHLKLEPEHLGKLTIKLFFNNGELNAHFYTGNEYVKDVLEGSIQQLRENLDQQDLRLNQAFVFVGDEGRSGMGQSNSESRQAAPFSGIYSGRAYREATTEPNGFEPPGSLDKLVNYLI